MIWQGAWPAVIDADGLARKAFYDALVARYVERDVRPLVNLAKPDKFRVFLRALAMVSGEELRFNVISRFAGVHTTTVKRWLTVAERTGLIYLLPPFDGRIGRQLVKSPKIYLMTRGFLRTFCASIRRRQWPSILWPKSFLRRLWLPKFSRAGCITAARLTFAFSKKAAGWKLLF